jgi:hypothetical protein
MGCFFDGVINEMERSKAAFGAAQTLPLEFTYICLLQNVGDLAVYLFRLGLGQANKGDAGKTPFVITGLIGVGDVGDGHALVRASLIGEGLTHW